MNCKTCRFYTPEEDKEQIGSCHNPKFVYTNGEETPLDGLGYWDYESYDAGFEVGENFGCIHYASQT